MTFALFMVSVLLFTGIVWLIDSLFFKKKRAEGAVDPVLVEYCKSFFPVILVVFTIRSFIVEPFKIPSGSMMSTLLVGDFILVNKFTYGLRVPILNNTFVEMNHPQRGEVMVFRYPKDESLDYIKRVVGLPGDKIGYHDKHLTVNGLPVDVTYTQDYVYQDAGLNQVLTKQYQEVLGEHKHIILIDESRPTLDGDFEVPQGQYFMMGDNRDNSNDSRYWGFVPEKNIVGRAFFIWFNFDELGRLGTKIN
jgi:signal peptidase I